MTKTPKTLYCQIMQGVITHFRNQIKWYIYLKRIDLAKHIARECRTEYKTMQWELQNY